MTTIAFREGILAADSQVTWDNSIRGFDPRKIKFLQPMTVFAGAGNNIEISKMERFYSKPDWDNRLDDLPEIKKSFEALLFHKGQLFYLTGNALPDPVYDPLIAIGSGWKLALAAMHMGKSAVDAVKFASTLDIYTNDQVFSLDVKNVQAATSKGGRKSQGVSKA